MLIGLLHDLEDPLDVRGWHVAVKEVGHRIDEYRSWLPPAQRQFQGVELKRQLKGIGVALLAHRLEAHSHDS